MKQSLVVLTIILLAPVALNGASPRPGMVEMRSRWTAKGKQASDVVHVQRLADSFSKSAFLVEQGSERYLILSVINYKEHLATNQIRNLNSGEYIRMDYSFMSRAASHAEFIEESKRDAASGVHADVAIRFRGPLGEFTTPDSQMMNDATRIALSGIVSPGFAAEVRKLQKDLLGHIELRLVCQQLAAPLLGGSCDRQSAPQAVGGKPDCAQDESFGFPCSASQKSRSKSAKVHPSTATRY